MSRTFCALVGFAAPYIVGLWLALMIVIYGAPITEEGIRTFGSLATGLAPFTAVLGWTLPGPTR